MTGSGDQRQKTTINATAAGTIADLPPSLTFVVAVNLPTNVQPDFKAHKRKIVDKEVPDQPSSLPSSSRQVPDLRSSSHSVQKPWIRKSGDIAPRPKNRHPTRPVQQPTTRGQYSGKPEPRPRSGLPNQRLPVDWYRSYRTKPTKFFDQADLRTGKANDDSGIRTIFTGKRDIIIGAGSSSGHRLPVRVTTTAPVYESVADAAQSTSQQEGTDSLASKDVSNVVIPCLITGEKAEDRSGQKTMGDEAKESNEKSANSRLLIKGGQVVNDDAVIVADVFVEDGIIKQIGPNLAVPGGARVLEAKGKYVLPGGIDTNTNFQLPFMGTTAIDDFYTGTKAALAGGTTMIIGNVLPQKGDSLLAAFEKWRSWADPKVCCDYGLSVAVPQWTEKMTEEMAQLATNGVNSFQFYMTYKDAFMLHDDELYRGFQQCRRVGAVARVHAENGDIIAAKQKELLTAGVTGPEGHLQSHPEEAEIEAITRACILAGQTNCPLYVLKITSRGAADAIGEAKRKGTIVVGETVVASLVTDGSHYFDKSWHHAANFVTSPPLRITPNTTKFLMQSLAGGDLQVTASTHCAYNSNQKAVGKDDFTKIPHGINGVEERLVLLWEKGVNTGRIDMMKFVAVTSTNAAKIFNIYPKKGRIAEGSDADIVIWDPQTAKTVSASSHHSKSDCNVFEGFACRGGPFITIAAGKIVFEDGQVHVTQGAGKFVPLPAHPPHLFLSIAAREQASRPIKVDRDSAGTKSPVGSGSSVTVSSPSPPTQRRSDPPPPYMEPLMPTTPKQDEFYTRPLTKAGSRNMQDSTFALSGTYPDYQGSQIDDSQGSKKSTRVSKPPGGDSRGLW